jgi:hypothetical protein
MTGGTVLGEGVMFYNTGDNYDPMTGTPDIDDGAGVPPASDGAITGGITINAAMSLSPIDSKNPAFDYSGDQAGIDVFDGMLIYQRRLNTKSADIQGDSSSGALTGTIYAKWSLFKISGQGTYYAQFVVGSMTIPGQGDVALTFGGIDLGKAPAVFLVE